MKITASQAITRRPAESRGKTELGWLHSRHSFSFGDYYDPSQMGFRSLRVLNDDIVEAGGGFPTHPHHDAEIFSYVIEGKLQHKDSMGHGSVIEAGHLQYMSAGEGVLHSEFNASETNRLHFLQIWLRPSQIGGKPLYAEKTLGNAVKDNALTLLFSGHPRNGAVAIRQDADIYFGRLQARKSLQLEPGAGRGVWLQVIKGTLHCLGETLKEGDGAGIAGEDVFEIEASARSEFLVFVMA